MDAAGGPGNLGGESEPQRGHNPCVVDVVLGHNVQVFSRGLSARNTSRQRGDHVINTASAATSGGSGRDPCSVGLDGPARRRRVSQVPEPAPSDQRLHNSVAWLLVEVPGEQEVSLLRVVGALDLKLLERVCLGCLPILVRAGCCDMGDTHIQELLCAGHWGIYPNLQPQGVVEGPHTVAEKALVRPHPCDDTCFRGPLADQRSDATHGL